MVGICGTIASIGDQEWSRHLGIFSCIECCSNLRSRSIYGLFQTIIQRVRFSLTSFRCFKCKQGGICWWMFRWHWYTQKNTKRWVIWQSDKCLKVNRPNERHCSNQTPTGVWLVRLEHRTSFLLLLLEWWRRRRRRRRRRRKRKKKIGRWCWWYFLLYETHAHITFRTEPNEKQYEHSNSNSNVKWQLLHLLKLSQSSFMQIVATSSTNISTSSSSNSSNIGTTLGSNQNSTLPPSSSPSYSLWFIPTWCWMQWVWWCI